MGDLAVDEGIVFAAAPGLVVGAVTAVDEVGSAAAANDVVPILPVEAVLPGASVDPVAVGTALRAVGAEAGAEPVRPA